MTTALALTSQQALAMVGQMANDYADGDIFNDFNGRKADNTMQRAYRSDLGSFATGFWAMPARALSTMAGAALQTTPEAWTGVTWGLVTKRSCNGS
jgi:hypothetical protein